MQLVLRIAAVLVAVIAYSGVTSYTLWRIDWANSDPERLFSGAILQAQLDKRKGGSSPLPLVCGFPQRGESWSLSHTEVVGIARCLHRGEHLSAASLAEIEDSEVSIPEGTCPGGSMPLLVRELWCGFHFDGVYTSNGVRTYYGGLYGRPWLTTLWLIGLLLVAWLVGFRLPFWRRRGELNPV